MTQTETPARTATLTSGAEVPADTCPLCSGPAIPADPTHPEEIGSYCETCTRTFDPATGALLDP